MASQVLAPINALLTRGLSRKEVIALVSAAAMLLALGHRICSGRSSTAPSTSSSRRVKGKDGRAHHETGTSRKKKIRVDGVFFRRLVALIKICIPRLVSVETGMVAALTGLLILRTRLTIVMATCVASNAECLVRRDAHGFFASVLDIGLWAFPSSVVNSGIKYMTQMMESRFRRNLQHGLHRMYLRGSAAYKTASKGAVVDHPDHRLTKDLQNFCTEVAEIYPQIFKPTIDVITFIYQLSQHGGILPPLGMVAYYILAGFMMKAVMPNFAKYTAQSQQKEGDLRWIHNQLIQHAEEVAFYRGERTEQQNADKAIDSLVKHSLKVKQLKSYSDLMDGILIKYGATCVGYAVCSVGVFALRDSATAAERTRVYTRSSQLYIPLAQAIGKLVLLHHRITALAGYTSRVSELQELLVELGRSGDVSSLAITEQRRCDFIDISNVTIGAPVHTGKTAAPCHATSTAVSTAVSPSQPESKEGLLIEGLSLKIVRGHSVMIMGSNGSGKSAFLRTLLGLWPLRAGTIVRPTLEEMCFVPQRTYLPHGTMREQLIFPDSSADAKRKNLTDAELMDLVDCVGLRSVVNREGGLDSFKEWHEVLSGGERQRVAFVRMLYHRPVFGVLDEATSAVSQDIEPAMYEAAVARGVTLITVSHRAGLMKYHDQLLTLTGDGQFKLEALENGEVVA